MKNENMDMMKHLREYAREDLALAREEGEIAVCETKVGLLTIRFNPEDNSFSMNGENMNEDQAVEFLANSFVVVEE